MIFWPMVYTDNGSFISCRMQCYIAFFDRIWTRLKCVATIAKT